MQGKKKGKRKREVIETELNVDMVKIKTEDIERGTKSGREAEKNPHEEETFKVRDHFIFHK